jgi:putative membrane protein
VRASRQIKEDHMKRRMTIACAFAAAITLVAGIAHSQTTDSQMNKADQQFMNEAIQGDLSEIDMGKLAQQKGKSQGVKQFGQMLEQDHGQHLRQAKGTAQQLGLTAPTQPNAKQKEMYDRLSKLSGAQFDKQFAQDMVNDHKEDIASYQRQVKSEGPLADFALQTVPTLQKHLQTAQSLSDQERNQQ